MDRVRVVSRVVSYTLPGIDSYVSGMGHERGKTKVYTGFVQDVMKG